MNRLDLFVKYNWSFWLLFLLWLKWEYPLTYQRLGIHYKNKLRISLIDKLAGVCLWCARIWNCPARKNEWIDSWFIYVCVCVCVGISEFRASHGVFSRILIWSYQLSLRKKFSVHSQINILNWINSLSIKEIILKNKYLFC